MQQRLYKRLNEENFYRVVKEILEHNKDQDTAVLNVPSESFILSLDCYEYIDDDSFDSIKMEEGWKMIKGEYK